MNMTLLNAAKYLVKEYGFAPIYIDEPMFNDPIVSASQSDTFDALHLLASVANGTDAKLISVRRVTEWLAQKSRAANA
jgi:hypothetical protein